LALAHSNSYPDPVPHAYVYAGAHLDAGTDSHVHARANTDGYTSTTHADTETASPATKAACHTNTY
jgi:hypothetical protein